VTVYSWQAYPGDGSTKAFSFTKPYIAQVHVIVTLNGVVTTAYTWTTATQITFDAAPASGALIKFARSTSPGTILVDFVNASSLDESVLDMAYLHNFYMAQEALDNLGNSVTQSAQVFAEAAAASAAAAAASATAAAASETNAATSETNAATSAAEAAASAASVNLPAIAGGDAGKMLKVNDAESAFEYIAQSAVASPVGGILMYVDAITPPSGWLFLNGDTIGDAASGADEEDAAYETLFGLIWDGMADGQAAVSGGRGASAAADWGAGKTITLPNSRGRANVGAGAGVGLTARTNGDVGGAETHGLVTAEMPAHTHSEKTASATVQSARAGSGQTVLSAINPDAAETTGSTGSGTAHNNMQPWLALAWIIKF
jgi:hypothetical protein